MSEDYTVGIDYASEPSRTVLAIRRRNKPNPFSSKYAEKRYGRLLRGDGPRANRKKRKAHNREAKRVACVIWASVQQFNFNPLFKYIQSSLREEYTADGGVYIQERITYPGDKANA